MLIPGEHHNINPDPFLFIAILGIIVLGSVYIAHFIWRVA